MAKHILVLFFGCLLGWLVRGYIGVEMIPPVGQRQDINDGASEPSRLLTLDGDSCYPVVVSSDDSETLIHDSKPSSTYKGFSILELLNRNRFTEAVSLYRKHLEISQADGQDSKNKILTHMNTLLDREEYEQFITFTDIFLSDFYSDLDVLLTRVNFNERMEYYTEALDLYQLAFSYAHDSESTRQVKEDFNRFISDVDTRLASQQRWSELINLYLHAEVVEVSSDVNRFRLAEIYVAAEDVSRALVLLRSLSSSHLVAEKSERLLKSLDEDGPHQIARETGIRRIPLNKRGDHYLVPIVVDQQELVLVLDTGASMTTLTQNKFDEISHWLDVEMRGVKMFNTANGISRGTIYQVGELEIGAFSLNSIEIAVLDFDMPPGVNGLLGMNTLRNFKFEIDQDSAELLLLPR